MVWPKNIIDLKNNLVDLFTKKFGWDSFITACWLIGALLVFIGVPLTVYAHWPFRSASPEARVVECTNDFVFPNESFERQTIEEGGFFNVIDGGNSIAIEYNGVLKGKSIYFADISAKELHKTVKIQAEVNEDYCIDMPTSQLIVRFEGIGKKPQRDSSRKSASFFIAHKRRT